MRKSFVCSLCYKGVIGGALYLDEDNLTFRTNKLTVNAKFRNLVLPLKEIESVAWKGIIATFMVKYYRKL